MTSAKCCCAWHLATLKNVCLCESDKKNMHARAVVCIGCRNDTSLIRSSDNMRVSSNCIQLLPNASYCFLLPPTASNCFQLLSTASPCRPHASDCFQMLPAASNCFHLRPTASTLFGTIWIVTDLRSFVRKRHLAQLEL